MKVFLDPRNRIIYSSFYIVGLQQKFGRRNVKYCSSPFKDLQRCTEENSFEQYMAFVVTGGGTYFKCIIDYRDTTEISERAYNWCQVYAKINISRNMNLYDFEKLISIPPGFGVRAYSRFYLSVLSLTNLIKCRFKPLRGLRDHFNDYGGSIKYSKTIDKFENPISEEDNYIFFVSSFWPHKNCIETTNPLRLAFMKSCKDIPGITFEGGFFFSGEVPKEYKQWAFYKRIPKSEYLLKIEQSLVVFNTPAVHNCHGWKLGEYLAMGKAILSTPISNRLPAELVDGENIVLVNTPEEMKKASISLLCNEDLRLRIKENNRRYYQHFVKPIAVINSILNKAYGK